jgi:hypothetical protein
MKDQVEMLTHERSSSAVESPAKEVIASLPSQESRNALLDSVVRESGDLVTPGEGRTLQGVETALTWITYGVVIAVSIVLAWSVGSHAMRYMMPH